jgi:hypothetical protein
MVALTGGTVLTAGLLVVAGSASPAAAAPGSGPTAVVALGDSAISGEGAGAYEPGTDGAGGDFCHRSTRALIQQTAVPGIQSRISLACSGAASSDVRISGTTHYTEPSQADRLRAVARDNGRCLTEFYGAGLAEGSCLRGADGALHAVAGLTAPTVRAGATVPTVPVS